jgi:putative ABC transport system permease protein
VQALNRKLLRDVWHLRAQVLALSLVIGSGVAVLVMSLSTIEALSETARAYYERYRFAHVFVQVERAPEALRERVRLLPGVQSVTTRIIKTASLEIAGFAEPVIGQLVSVPELGEPELNRLALRAGRMPARRAVDEVVLSEPFAEAHAMQPGDRLRAIINGRWRELTVVGVALSPEYVYTIGPGALIPDDERFGIIWMGQEALQAAFDLDGAFNDMSVGLMHGTPPAAVIEALDEMLERYGGRGAYARPDQQSNWFLMNEISQLRTLSLILPATFLVVAAFLTNVLLGRIIAVERGEIGLLKAFGYGNSAIAWHYLKLASVIAAVGVTVGWLAGYGFGKTSTEVYADFFRFPFLLYHPGPQAFLIGALASTAAALAGALDAVRRVVQLPPAEAMQPPAPPLFRRGGLSHLPLLRWLDQPTRILLRQVGRWPGRAFITSLGIGMAVAILVSSIHWLDAVDQLADVYFEQAQRQDLTVSFAQPQDSAVEGNLARLPGVITTEALRSVPTKMRFGPREERQALLGVPARQELLRVHDAQTGALALPPDGMVLSTQLAEMLQAHVGDVITVEVLEGRRPTLRLPVAALFETYIGSPAYMEIGALNRALGEGNALNSVHLRVDPLDKPALYTALKDTPRISAVTLREAALRGFHDTLADTILIFVFFFVVFACALAMGVTYNAARIALSERGRELATLEVLGYTHAEISYLLLGEVAVLTLLAFPLGSAAGYFLALIWHDAFVTELFRVPFAILPKTYGLSIVITIIGTVLSALLVRRRLDHLDLIAVLKTRE